MGSDDLDAQLTAINNTRFLFANLLGKQYSARSLAFCCLVETVDGENWPDYSPEGIERMSIQLDIPDEVVSQYWETLKKKSMPN
ncbi:hypothetical protein [Spirosoma spitsbergense]|uniref:hypothetical protein n=1 Tax=Spirosoma spitsbergense TaxID=431554 RepID=UPI00039A06AE|nr:hypothetical protein [Spirosoma spitsbergense]